MTNHENAAGPPAAADGPPPTPETIVTVCGNGSCPTVYRTDHDTLLVQGSAVTGITAPDGELVVEIPRELLLEAARRIQERND